MAGFISSIVRRPLTELPLLATRRGAKNRGWYFRGLEEVKERAAEAAATPATPFPAPAAGAKKRARAYLDFDLGKGGKPARVVIELADDLLPKTTSNFIALCQGKSGLTYKGTQINKIVPQFMVSAGDFTGDGRGGQSSFGTKYFEDESFVGRHTCRGVVSMANAGVNSNSSVFFITSKALPHLDGRHVAFGKVVEGLEALNALEGVYTVNRKPISPVTIVDCGLL